MSRKVKIQWAALTLTAMLAIMPLSSGRAEEKEQETAAEEQPLLTQVTEDDPAIAYILVENPGLIGFLPLPLEGEYKKTFRQTAPDGTEWVNVLHVTPEGFRMEKSNCEGQDCVLEGEVTLENRETRALWNMVVCLPHSLVFELVTREELIRLIGD